MGGRQVPDPFDEVNTPEFLDLLLQDGQPAQRAFGKLFKNTHARLLAFIGRYLGNLEECQEVLQETYLAVHRGLPKFERKSRLTTWIFSMAYHKICDRYADKDRKHVELSASLELLPATANETSAVYADISPWDATSDLVSEKRMVLEWIQKATALLPPAQREVYRLKDEDGLSGEEIAALLGMPAATVRVHLHRARGQIVQWVRERLEKRVP
jgi:RNA polymerase sigma-70 factor (ECF subfamily)